MKVFRGFGQLRATEARTTKFRTSLLQKLIDLTKIREDSINTIYTL